MLSLLLLLQIALPPERVSRVDRLAAWVMLVGDHEPGKVDAAVQRIGLWSPEELDRLRRDLGSLRVVARDPQALNGTTLIGTTRLTRDDPGLTNNELKSLRALARGYGTLLDFDAVLKRGALLHMDIAMLAPAQSGGSPNSFQYTTLHMHDGQQLGLANAVGHWIMARSLLDDVRPDPGRPDTRDPGADPWVRLWYRASTAFMQRESKLEVVHFDRALRLFPRDAPILFMAGSLHETLSGPRVQTGIRSARVPPGVTFNVGSERAQLRRAESLFRRALAADPNHVEARIRLGRVLGVLGESAEALRELQVAAAAAGDRLLEYYAQLFRGREADVVGDTALARRSYERAVALFPGTQSPRLALHQLASRAGTRVAFSSTSSALMLSAGDERRDDPWWSYYHSAGRSAEALLAELRVTAPEVTW